MEQITLLALTVLGVLPEFSVAMLPILGGCASSSYSSSPVSLTCQYGLIFFVKGQSTGTQMYNSSHLHMTLYDNPSNFDYRLTDSNDQPIFRNDGRNTDILFLFDNKMKIHAKNNVKFTYSIVFTVANHANIFAGLITAVAPGQYLRCEGSHTYKIEKIYVRSSSGALTEMPGNWCIFKNIIRKTRTTTLMIRSTTQTQDQRDPLIIFRSTDYRLTPELDANFLGLSIVLGGETQNPKYILETSTPDLIRRFLA